MTALALLNHALNFMAPAFWVAVLMPLAGRIFWKRRGFAPALWAQAAANFVLGTLVLAVGLWYFGRDGKMATYAGMTLICGTGQWFMLRGWG